MTVPCIFQYISCMKVNFMRFIHGSCFHACFMHEICMNHAWFKTLTLPCIKRVCDRYTMVPCTMHEVSHYIILIRSSCFVDFKKCKTLRKFQCSSKWLPARRLISRFISCTIIAQRANFADGWGVFRREVHTA